MSANHDGELLKIPNRIGVRAYRPAEYLEVDIVSPADLESGEPAYLLKTVEGNRLVMALRGTVVNGGVGPGSGDVYYHYPTPEERERFLNRARAEMTKRDLRSRLKRFDPRRIIKSLSSR